MDTDRKEVARRFGELATSLAKRKGYDVEPYAGGRAQLARDLGIHPSMVGRALDGKVVPKNDQFPKWARVLDVKSRDLMVDSGAISPDEWPEGDVPDVLSVTSQSPPLSPEEAVDAWKIRNPVLRSSLIANINHALALQAEEDARAPHGTDGGAVARG
ncbi:helix-turn-helix domain-containing protein [Streptomyces sp. NPDC057456]|uniref:helix-turn-helix domain-containing protein n=1 Tax=Streptomyces sp. NPDC057456 TaxID=3346139 RepID=UPI003692294F